MTPAPDAWARLEAALARIVPALPAALAPPAASDALDALAQRTGHDVQAALGPLYRHHDGQSADAPGLFLGLRFLSAAEAGDEWGRWSAMVHDDPALVADIAVTARPEAPSGPSTTPTPGCPSPPTAPATASPSTSTLGPQGTSGQVISFGADEPTRTVVAPSAAALARVARRSHRRRHRHRRADDPDAPGGQVLALGGATHLLDALPAIVEELARADPGRA